MNWKAHLHSNPKILLGKPVIKGTRISESIQAVFAFAAECLKEDVFYTPLLFAEAS
jgi:hypothetical protein